MAPLMTALQPPLMHTSSLAFNKPKGVWSAVAHDSANATRLHDRGLRGWLQGGPIVGQARQADLLGSIGQAAQRRLAHCGWEGIQAAISGGVGGGGGR